ncbi:MAG: response regulator transcription factor [Clostridia bacterium]|nr:response regulator transcription factor [Clostridia bacterium]
MNFAIVDDDKVFSQSLQKYISDFCKSKGINSSVSITDPESLFLGEGAPFIYDIIFLDIDMPELSGIELAHKLNTIKPIDSTPYIIFVTGQDNLVFDALQTFPYSFVRKSHLTEIENCIMNLESRLCATPTYAIKTGRDIKITEIKNIIYLEKLGNYTAFVTLAGTFQERASIDEKFKELKNLGFIRPHIGFLANATHITEFTSSSLKLSNGKEIAISRSYRHSAKEEFNEWLVRAK